MTAKRLVVLTTVASAVLASHAAPALATDVPGCSYHHDSTHNWVEISTANFASHFQAAQATRTDRNSDGFICYLNPPRSDRYRIRDNQL